MLSHQINVVNSLARFFENVVVLTGNVGTFTLSQNVSVVNCKWIEGNNIRNSLVFYLKALPLLMKKDCVFFFHMTDVQSALLAPFTLCFRVKHILWYAHKKVSIYLWITSFFNRIILTASVGSCSLPKKKFSVIGHGIETELFNFKERENYTLDRLVSIGRLDESKGIDVMIESFMNLQKSRTDLTLHFYGAPSNKKSRNYMSWVKSRYSSSLDHGIVQFHDQVKRSMVVTLFEDYDIFLHAYQGSLDKSILEASLVGVPVVTLNREYLSIFGSWSNHSVLSLENELTYILKMDAGALRSEISRRSSLCAELFSMDKWTQSIFFFLTSQVI